MTERYKNISSHIWAEAFGGGLGDKVCVRCGAVINLFQRENLVTEVDECPIKLEVIKEYDFDESVNLCDRKYNYICGATPRWK